MTTVLIVVVVVVVLAVALLASSLRVIRAYERGVVTRFGKPAGNAVRAW